MTAQVTDTLIYNDEKLALCAELLGEYLAILGHDTPFKAPNTACWRGYVGQWVICNDRLYITALRGWIKDRTEVDLSYLFPDYPKKAFAHWVNREIKTTRGKLLDYVHGGFESVYEEELLFEIEYGVIKSVTIKKNN
jgi:hypothetical protein